jgi:hypothetical protein
VKWLKIKKKMFNYQIRLTIVLSELKLDSEQVPNNLSWHFLWTAVWQAKNRILKDFFFNLFIFKTTILRWLFFSKKKNCVIFLLIFRENRFHKFWNIIAKKWNEIKKWRRLVIFKMTSFFDSQSIKLKLELYQSWWYSLLHW